MRANSASATALFASASWYLARSSGLSIRTRIAPAVTSWPRLTGIRATRPSTRAAISVRVLSASPWIIRGGGTARYQAEAAMIPMTRRATTMAAGAPLCFFPAGFFASGFGGAGAALGNACVGSAFDFSRAGAGSLTIGFSGVVDILHLLSPVQAARGHYVNTGRLRAESREIEHTPARPESL